MIDPPVSVSIIAEPIKNASTPPHATIGQQVRMGDCLHFHITATMARQWIGVLTKIAKEPNA